FRRFRAGESNCEARLSRGADAQAGVDGGGEAKHCAIREGRDALGDWVEKCASGGLSGKSVYAGVSVDDCGGGRGGDRGMAGCRSSLSGSVSDFATERGVDRWRLGTR